jgi:hypothetical protein
MLRAFGATGMDYEEFTRRYCEWNDYLGCIVGTKAEHIDELKALLATVMLRRMRKDVAPDMPAIDFQFLEVEPEAKKDLKVPAGTLRGAAAGVDGGEPGGRQGRPGAGGDGEGQAPRRRDRERPDG